MGRSDRLGFWKSVRRVFFLTFSMVWLLGSLESVSEVATEVGTARANATWASDVDLDGIPDEVELIFGLQPYVADTDGDGYRDGVEWTLRSDPLDSASQPTLQASLRSYAYETTQGNVKVFTMLFPGNVNLLDEFLVHLGSPNLTNAPLGDRDMGILDFTPFLTSVPNQFTSSNSNGMGVVSFTFELSMSLVNTYAPLSVGVAANLVGTPVVDQMSLTRQNGTSMVFFPDPSVVPGAGQTPSNYWFLPLNPAPAVGGGGGGGGGSDPEYCATTLDGGDPTGAGGIAYTVQSADCVPDGLLYCVDSDCDSLAGQTLILIDYGFLKSKADG